MSRASSGEEGLLVSYLTLRRLVGILGVALPIVLAVWGWRISGRLEPSISDYYRLRTRDVLVGTLYAVGWFLFTYRGYERKDNVAGNLACLFALGVALCPVTYPGVTHVLHYCSATALFLVLAYFSLVLFTKTGTSAPTRQKLVRNRVYMACGGVILACIALCGLYLWVLSPVLSSLNPIFWLETFALWAFGVSWFIKGETLWRDSGPREEKRRLVPSVAAEHPQVRKSARQP